MSWQKSKGRPCAGRFRTGDGAGRATARATRRAPGCRRSPFRNKDQAMFVILLRCAAERQGAWPSGKGREPAGDGRALLVG